MPALFPKFVWNLLFVVFLATFAVTGGVLLGGDPSPIVRLAFSLCGSICLYAGHAGDVSSATRRGIRSWHDLCVRKRLHGFICVMLFLAGLISLMTIPFLQARNMARVAGVAGELKVYGLALLEYAEANQGTLPPHTGRKHVDSYLGPYRRAASAPPTGFGKPFVWCNALSGLRLSDIEKPEAVIVAYTCEPAGSYGYAALYLDGHVKHLRRKQLREQLRERESLLAPAIQARMRRLNRVLKPGVNGER